MITLLARKLVEHAIVPGPGTVHISTYPLMKAGGALMPQEKKEANSASAAPQVLRKKESMQESNPTKPYKTSKTMEIRSRFREADNLTQGNKFEVILIQEGLGNFKSAFYYTKGCLQSSATIFEGKKCYADHPSAIDEQARPERSTRDILGYFEGVQYAEAADGRGMIKGNLCLEATVSSEWARSLLTNSLEYAKKYTDKDFVGLSINANGEAEPTGLDEFMKSSQIPESAIPKLLEAKQMGVEQIQVVKSLKDAVSCDLVTEAGAGGKILSMIESQKGKAMGKLKETKEAGVPSSPGKTGPLPVKGQEGDDGAPAAAGAKDGSGHADADQDKALFAKMIKQYLGDDQEPTEESMKMAKHAYQAHKENGMEDEAAYEAAGNHLKMAMAIGKKMSQDESEAHEAGDADGDDSGAPDAKTPPPAAGKKPPMKSDDECKASEDESESESESKKESNQKICKGCIEKSAQLSKLKESMRTIELNQYLEKKCVESKLPVKITKEARTVLGVPKNKEHIDQVLETFKRVHKSALEDAGNDSWFMPEKTQFVESDSKGKLGSFADCANS